METLLDLMPVKTGQLRARDALRPYAPYAAVQVTKDQGLGRSKLKKGVLPSDEMSQMNGIMLASYRIPDEARMTKEDADTEITAQRDSDLQISDGVMEQTIPPAQVKISSTVERMHEYNNIYMLNKFGSVTPSSIHQQILLGQEGVAAFVDQRDVDIRKFRAELLASREHSKSLKAILETLKADTELKLGTVQ
jgi:hypothetical protein